MKLSELLDKHSHVRLASSEDNTAILNFYDDIPMKGKGLKVRYERRPDFFKFLNFQSRDSFVLLLEDDQGELSGVATLVIRPGCVRGEDCYVGYLGDLRIKFDRRGAVRWRRFYQDLMQFAPEVDEFYYCKHFITAIMDENSDAISALVNSKKNAYTYLPLSKYNMINIMFKNLLSPNHLLKSKYKTRFASNEDKEAIKTFFKNENQKIPFGFQMSDSYSEIHYRLENWTDFDISNFILCFDDKENLVGMTGLWTHSPVKKIILDSLPSSYKILFEALRPFTKMPKETEELKALYLTHLCINISLPESARAAIFKGILNCLYKTKLVDDYHCISFCDFDNVSLLKGAKGYVYTKTPMSLFQVLHKDFLEDNLTNPEQLPAPGFEMSLV